MAKRKRRTKSKMQLKSGLEKTEAGYVRVFGPYPLKSWAETAARNAVHLYGTAKRSRIFEMEHKGKKVWFVKFYGWNEERFQKMLSALRQR
jgi:hypothetical protein